MWLDDLDIDIVVVANKRKEMITHSFLRELPHRIFYTTDYVPDKELKSEWIPSTALLGAYRCFKGHQDAISSSSKENILIFEDDVVVPNDEWLSVVRKSISLLNSFEVVNLHARLVRKQACSYFSYKDLTFLCPKHNELLDSGKNIKVYPNKFFCVAAMAYLVNKRSIEKITSFQFTGVPFDILLWKEFSYCFLEKSPFIHDRCKGSLVENRKAVK